MQDLQLRRGNKNATGNKATLTQPDESKDESRSLEVELWVLGLRSANICVDGNGIKEVVGILLINFRHCGIS